MGAACSRGGFNTVDDSVHVMLKKDKKAQSKKGEAPHGYVARTEHPLVKAKSRPVTAEEDGTNIEIPNDIPKE